MIFSWEPLLDIVPIGLSFSWKDFAIVFINQITIHLISPSWRAQWISRKFEILFLFLKLTLSQIKYLSWVSSSNVLKMRKWGVWYEVGGSSQSCPTLKTFMGYSLPGSSAHWTFQARIWKWVAIFLLRSISLTTPGIKLASSALVVACYLFIFTIEASKKEQKTKGSKTVSEKSSCQFTS